MSTCKPHSKRDRRRSANPGVLFGVVSDAAGLQWTFVVMLVPLGASAWLLFKARRTYPQDVATAAAVAQSSGYARLAVDEHW